MENEGGGAKTEKVIKSFGSVLEFFFARAAEFELYRESSKSSIIKVTKLFKEVHFCIEQYIIVP